MKLYILCLFVLALTGCTSAIKKQCKSTNWFTYGESVAMQGRRTRDDDFVKACEKEKVEIDFAALSRGFQKGYATYCTPEAAFRLGKQGEFLKADFCEGTTEEQLIKKQHAMGVREYCQPANGTVVGATGKKYNNICPNSLEAKFLEKFNIGRKKYLTALIAANEKTIESLDRDLRDLQRQKSYASAEVLTVMNQKPPDMIWVIDAAGHRVQQPNTNAINAYNSELDRQRDDVERLDTQIGSKRSQQDTLQKEIRDAQVELGTLD